MKLFLFETNVPAWSNPTELDLRISLWKSANISTIFLMVDDGRGATWPSQSTPVDPRITLSNNPLKNAVQKIRNSGIQVFLVVNVIGIVLGVNPIKSEYLIQTGDYYDMWNPAFRDWRIAYLRELFDHTLCDGVVLDYIRTGKGALIDQTPSSELVADFLFRIRSEVPEHIALMNISNTFYLNPNVQGVNYLQWYQDGLIDSIGIFNYNEQFPFRDVERLPQTSLWILRSSYNLVNNVAVSKSAYEIESSARRILRRFTPAGYGLFTANMFTSEHASVFSQLPLQEKRR